MKQFQHTRSAGKRRTYDITIEGNHYTIALNGKVLKDETLPIFVGGNVTCDEAETVHVLADIEQLRGMPEE